MAIKSIKNNLTFYTHCAQQAGIFAQCTHTAHKAQQERDGAQDYEHKSWIQGNERQFTNVAKHILFRPGPNANCENQ